MKKLLIIIFALTVYGTQAQQIKDFSLPDVRNNDQFTLSNHKKAKGLVIIFTSNICPYSVYYEGRITQLISDYEDKGIQFVMINSHLEDKESAEEMANKLSTWGLNVPYLADKDQVVLRMFGATKSPEVYVLKPEGDFKVVYKGAIDNNPQVATDVKDQYLKENLELLISGKPAQTGGRPIGCMIKKN